ncbi:MAG TPA: glycosyltransferase family 39 protein [Spirochaetia bacterium]|nr:glycosyltransferase family 39 protein [Spirochaetia bacterium]
MKPQSTPAPFPPASYVLALILLAAAGLRFYAFNFGLPELYHPDEMVASQEVARFMRGEYGLERYHHPPLFRMIAFLGLKTVSLIAPIPDDSMIISAVYALRTVSVLAGILTVAFLYRLSRYFLTEAFSLITAGLYAFLPLAAVLSKHGLPDTLLTLMFLINLCLQMRMTRGGPRRLFFLSGLFLALAFATKYNGVFLTISFLISLFYYTKTVREGFRAVVLSKRALFFLAGAGIGLFLGFPLVFFGEGGILWRSLLEERAHLFEQGHFGLFISGAEYFYTFHFQKSVLPCCGPVLLLAILAGLTLMLLRRKPAEVVLLGVVLPYYLFMDWVYKLPVNFEHYVLPLLPIYTLSAVVLLSWLLSGRLKDIHPKLKASAILLLTAALAAYPLYSTARIVPTLVPDTRDVMRRWMREQLPAGSRILFPELETTGYYPPVHRDGFTVATFKRFNPDINALKGDVDFVVASSLVYDRYFTYPEELPDHTYFYRTLFSKAKLLREVKPVFRSYIIHNPTLRVYSLQ